MAHHLLGFESRFHGYFSRELDPVLTIDSGDSVEYSIPDAAWNIRPGRHPGDAPEKMKRPNPELDKGHCLAGPIRIAGAKPGHTLEIKVEELEVGGAGWTSSGGWPHAVHKRLGTDESPEATLYWELDRANATGRDQFGHRVELRPFLGVMGMPPDLPGTHWTAPPRRTGGNLDCKEIVQGATLFLPIEVEGGLFSAGDGHAAQGDGEVCVTAIECPIQKAVLTFRLREDLQIGSPRVRTSDAWITLGVHEDLDEAVYRALEEMIALMEDRYRLHRNQALALASVVADVRVTQIVNGVKGAHVLLRDDAVY